MSNLITGANLPADLLAVLRKYGLPDCTLSFKIECSVDDLLLITATFYGREPKAGEDFQAVEETRTFKILAVE